MFDHLQRTLINGISLAYRTAGNGDPPVVMVHGSASDIRTWDGHVEALSDTRRVIAYSRRYARPNEDIPDGLDDQMEPHVEDLIALLNHLDARPAHIVGHSWGGFIGLLAAIRYPDAVRSLVLMEPPVLTLFVSMPPKPAELLKLLFRRPKAAFAIMKFGAGTVGPAEKAFRRGDNDAGVDAFGRGVLGNDAFERLSEARREQVRQNARADKAQLLGAGFPPLDDHDLRRVQTPVLLLHGEKSPPLFRYLLARLAELLPNADRVEVPQASHIMHEDNPRFFQETVTTFLRSR